MADRILVIDDDTLMRPGLAVHLERTGYRRNSAVSAVEATPVIQGYPPEVIFLTARRAKLDQVLRLELGADDHVVKPFDLDVRLARIKANLAAQRALATARWRQVWAPAIFALGVLLLVLAAPRWMRWTQDVMTYQLPTEEMVWNWLTKLAFDPTGTSASLLSRTVKTWLNPGGQTDVTMTLGIIMLAVASVAGLVQLLGDRRKDTLPGA